MMLMMFMMIVIIILMLPLLPQPMHLIAAVLRCLFVITDANEESCDFIALSDICAPVYHRLLLITMDTSLQRDFTQTSNDADAIEDSRALCVVYALGLLCNVVTCGHLMPTIYREPTPQGNSPCAAPGTGPLITTIDSLQNRLMTLISLYSPVSMPLMNEHDDERDDEHYVECDDEHDDDEPLTCL